MSDNPAIVTRRQILQGAAVLMGTISTSSILATLAPSRAWALEMKSLSGPEGETILSMAQTLYPHATLPTAVYALVVKDLDAKAAGDPAAAGRLRDGVAALDKAAGGPFKAASPQMRLSAVTTLKGTPFFETVRGQCITSLYNNEMAFAHFGYPGPSWQHGGYLRSGFQDLTWLPDPPKPASPAPYLS